MPEEEQSFGCYGIVVPETKFHTSPLCPSLKTVIRWKQGELSRYVRETDAIMMGHIKRCPVCFNMYRFKIRVNSIDYEYLLDTQDIKLLSAMAVQHRANEKITVTGLAEKCGVEYSSANDIIKKLKKLKLVSSAEFSLGIQVRGRRKFTPLGVAVVTAYEAGIYGRPLSESQSPTDIITKPSNRLI